MTILVVGGACYIGSHMVKHLSNAKHSVVMLDNLITRFHELACYSELVVGDLAETCGGLGNDTSSSQLSFLHA